MGLYANQILPRIIDKSLSGSEMLEYRSETAAGLSGTVVEIGFGSGLNLPAYPPEVTRVYAVDPSALGRKLAADRIEESKAEVVHVGLDGSSLPLDDDSCDGALSTLTLCTVPDPAKALAELRRVVRPGGPIHLLEHGLARVDKVATWQRRLNPLQRRVGDGCQLDRDHLALANDAGLEIEEHREWFVKGPKPMSSFYLLRTRNPA